MIIYTANKKGEKDRTFSPFPDATLKGPSTMFALIKYYLIDFQINNFTALSVKILDDVQLSTTYSDFSFYPCEINYLKIYRKLWVSKVDKIMILPVSKANLSLRYISRITPAILFV